MAHLHDLLEGGNIIANPMATLRIDDTRVPIMLFGVEYGPELPTSYFAIGLNPYLLERLDIPEAICQTCVNEQAAEILGGIDLDAGLDELQRDQPPTDQPPK